MCLSFGYNVKIALFMFVSFCVHFRVQKLFVSIIYRKEIFLLYSHSLVTDFGIFS